MFMIVFDDLASEYLVFNKKLLHLQELAIIRIISPFLLIFRKSS